jgi:Fe-S-cluster containining protein
MRQSDITPISHDEPFDFSCSPEVPCFNQCCRNLNQFLTPYDVLRLKACLNLPSSLFLERFTVRHSGPETGFPVVAFKTDPASGHICPFVTDAGCRVYRDRPASCRMYPIARAVSRSRETAKITEHFAVLREPHCQGHQRPKRQTVRQWIDTQGLRLYNRYNDLLLELIYRKNRMRPGPLGPEASQRFYLALYDLDAFRITAFDNGVFNTLTIDRNTDERARQEDTALLELGIDWLKNTIFKL